MTKDINPLVDDCEKQIKELLSQQRTMCADAFWNNRFGFMTHISPKDCKDMMLYIENYDAPDFAPLQQKIKKQDSQIKKLCIDNDFADDYIAELEFKIKSLQKEIEVIK